MFSNTTSFQELYIKQQEDGSKETTKKCSWSKPVNCLEQNAFHILFAEGTHTSKGKKKDEKIKKKYKNSEEDFLFG